MNRIPHFLISCNGESFVLHSCDCRDVPALGGPDLTDRKREKSPPNVFSRLKDHISIIKFTGSWKQGIIRVTVS